MIAYILCFVLGAALGLFASEFADRWGCSQRYRSSLPKKIFIAFTAGLAAAALYAWEVEMGMLMPAHMPTMKVFSAHEAFGYFLIFFLRYALHLLLFVFLLAATLTDFYEMIIPDTITITGTVCALCLAVLLPYAPLPATVLLNEDDMANTAKFHEGDLPKLAETHPELTEYLAESLEMFRWYKENKVAVAPINVWSPNKPQWDFPYRIGIGDKGSVVIPKFLPAMIFLWWFWCFAMLDRVWYTQLPFRKAHAIFWRYLYRSPRTKYIIAAALLGPIGLALIVFVPEGAFVLMANVEIALYSSLVGMATGMMLVWGVRLVARWVLGVEAMGFGDVTLMGMIGAFLGWQAVLLVFFLAPFFGLVYGIINVAIGRGRAVPYGPFLCLAAVTVVIFWRFVWQETAEYFAFGIGTIGIALLVLLVVFGGLLHVVHKIFAGLRRD